MEKKVLYIVNNISPSSIPVEVANKLVNNFEIIILSLYDSCKEVKRKKDNNKLNTKVIGIGLKNKFNLLSYRKLYHKLNQINPDIIHTHHTLSGLLGRIFGKLMKSTYVVTTIHNDMRFFNQYQSLTRGLTLNLADYIVCNSYNTQKSFLKWQDKLIDSNKKRVVYNGIDINKILSFKQSDIRSKFNIDQEEFLIGNVAMLEKQKDQVTLIKAFAEFNQKINSSKLIIVGDGSLKQKLKGLVEELQIENDVIFTGLISRDEVYKIINSLDLFVMSSLWEGFCNAMVEAMVAQNPIIATEVSPLPEVAGEENAIFFTKQDYNELVNKMIMLYENQELRNKLALKAKEYAIENYSLDKCAENHKKIYLELLNR